MSLFFDFPRGGAEEAAGGDQCGLPAAGAGKGAEQKAGSGAEDERRPQNQVTDQQHGKVQRFWSRVVWETLTRHFAKVTAGRVGSGVGAGATNRSISSPVGGKFHKVVCLCEMERRSKRNKSHNDPSSQVQSKDHVISWYTLTTKRYQSQSTR